MNQSRQSRLGGLTQSASLFQTFLILPLLTRAAEVVPKDFLDIAAGYTRRHMRLAEVEFGVSHLNMLDSSGSEVWVHLVRSQSDLHLLLLELHLSLPV